MAKAKRTGRKVSGRQPRFWYVAQYGCGCSADAYRRADILNYCATHGRDRKILMKLPNLPSTRNTRP